MQSFTAGSILNAVLHIARVKAKVETHTMYKQSDNKGLHVFFSVCIITTFIHSNVSSEKFYWMLAKYSWYTAVLFIVYQFVLQVLFYWNTQLFKKTVKKTLNSICATAIKRYYIISWVLNMITAKIILYEINGSNDRINYLIWVTAFFHHFRFLRCEVDQYQISIRIHH